MDSLRKQIDELCEHLNKAIDAYYNQSREIMSNAEFDDAMKYLNNLQQIAGYAPSNSPIGKVGAPVSNADLQTVVHEFRARSLDKTKDIDEVIAKLKLDNTSKVDVAAMWKLDGCTLVLTYVDGDLVLAATRGDGEKGLNVTRNVKYIKGIPQHIDMNKGKIVVRGECVISYADFEKINNSLPDDVEPYANPRNLASASLTMKNPDDMKNRCLTFQAFDFMLAEGSPAFGNQSDSPDSLTNQFDYLWRNHFGVVDYRLLDISEVAIVKDYFTERVKDYEYPVDGLVFAIDDRNISKNLPGTEHHPDPKYGYAFKWADEEVETQLLDIEWSPSRTGLLNPVAIFKPVQIAGTTVSRASLHNVTYIKDRLLNIGDTITVLKSNLIIPQLGHNLSIEVGQEEKRINNIIIHIVPKTCPTCGGQTEIRNDGLSEMCYCSNPNCPEKLIGKLSHFCSREGMDIDGWSEQTIKKLIDLKMVKDYRDIFLLNNYPALSLVPGFGKKSWEKLCRSADDAKQSATFVKFVSALSIPGVSKGQAKVIKNYIDDNHVRLQAAYGPDKYSPFDTFISMGLLGFEFSVITGIGEVLATNITTWIKQHFDCNPVYIELRNMMVFTDIEPVAEDFMNPPTNSKVAGKSFCITGKLIHHANRQELVDLIEANGGKWVDSVSSKTDYLINNDKESTSGKNKKAKELNIPIISEDDFMSMLA